MNKICKACDCCNDCLCYDQYSRCTKDDMQNILETLGIEE